MNIQYELSFEKDLKKIKNKSIKKSDKLIIDRKRLSTATVVGTRNDLYAKALAEKTVMQSGEMVYLSVNFQENNEELFLEAIDLINQFLNSNNLRNNKN